MSAPRVDWSRFTAAERAALVLLPEATLSWVLSLSEDTYRSVRRAAASHIAQLTDPALLTMLAQHRYPEPRRAAAQNPNTPGEVLSLLWKAGATPDLSTFSKESQPLTPNEISQLQEGGVFARCLLARHPDTPAELRLSLAKDPAKEVRSALAFSFGLPSIEGEPYKVRRAHAKNRRSAATLLEKLSQDQHPGVRAAVAQNFSLPSSLFEPLLRKERHPRVQQGAAQNPSVPKEWLVSLSERFPKEILENPAFPLLQLEEPDLQSRLGFQTLRYLASKRPPPEGFCEWALSEKKTSLFATIAANPGAPKEALAKLLCTQQESVRRLARHNPNAPQDIIRRLREAGASEDLTSLEESQAALTQNELEELCRLGALGRMLVVRHPKTPTELRLKILNEEDPYEINVCRAALELPSLTGEEFWAAYRPGLARQIAQHPGLKPEDVLTWSKADAFFLTELAQRPNLPESVIRFLLLKDFEQPLVQLILHQDLSEEHLRWLATHRSPKVRVEVTRLPNPPLAFLQGLWKAGAHRNLIFYQRPSAPVDPALLEELASLGPFGQRLAALNPNTPAPLLEVLSRATDNDVLQALAQNPSAPKEFLTQLYQQDRFVEELARNPSMSPEQLGSLLKRFPTLKSAILQNPNTPTDISVSLLGDWEIDARENYPIERERVLLRLLERPDIQPLSVLRLATGPYQAVRVAASSHPKLDAKVKERLRKAGATLDLARYEAPTLGLLPVELRNLLRLGPYAQALAALHPDITDALLQDLPPYLGGLRRLWEQLDYGKIRARLRSHPICPEASRLLRETDREFRELPE